jgi:antitoxin (DNA-binding transcriptional repressor) of toxin-antitoxin stability system
MNTLSVTDFETNFSAILMRVKNGENIGISYGNSKKPIAKIIPIDTFIDASRNIGILEGIATFKEYGDGKISEEEFLGL